MKPRDKPLKSKRIPISKSPKVRTKSGHSGSVSLTDLNYVDFDARNFEAISVMILVVIS